MKNQAVSTSTISIPLLLASPPPPTHLLSSRARRSGDLCPKAHFGLTSVGTTWRQKACLACPGWPAPPSNVSTQKAASIVIDRATMELGDRTSRVPAIGMYPDNP